MWQLPPTFGDAINELVDSYQRIYKLRQHYKDILSKKEDKRTKYERHGNLDPRFFQKNVVRIASKTYTFESRYNLLPMSNAEYVLDLFYSILLEGFNYKRRLVLNI